MDAVLFELWLNLPNSSSTGSPLQGGRRGLCREPGPELAGGAVRPRAADVQPQGALGAAVPRGPLLRHAHVLPVRIHAQVSAIYDNRVTILVGNN